MALQEKQKKVLLASLLLVFLLIIAINSGTLVNMLGLGKSSSTDEEVIPPTSYSDLQRREQEERFPEIQMGQLEEKSQSSDDMKRDPFTFSRAPGGDRDTQIDLAQERADEMQRKMEEQRQATEAAPPPPSDIEMKFAGYAARDDIARAVFLDDKEVIIGGEGDVINDNFVIIKIGYESIIMGYVNHEKTQEITMKGS